MTGFSTGESPGDDPIDVSAEVDVLPERGLSQVEDWDLVVKRDSLLESLKSGGVSTKDTTAAILMYTYGFS